MKNLILFILLLPLTLKSQQTINSSIIHDNLTRDYILYLPATYDGSESVPLIINFHGYGSNAFEQMNYGDFRPIADTAGFLVVQPQGELLNGISHWNVGGWTIGSTVDDVGFTAALIDSLSELYNIDEDRVYATGMSNGGFMSFLLACQLGDKIAAVAPVAASMTPETYDECSPDHSMPILQFHGTTDNVVPYGGAIWTKPVQDAIDYWVEYNNCYPLPTIIEIPDNDPNDGSTVEHIIYPSGNNGVRTEHFKIYGGGHTWPGSAFGGAGTNYDINASNEIWKFFLKYDINGSILPTSLVEKNSSDFMFFPNPVTDKVIIHSPIPNSEVSFYNLYGKLLLQSVANNKTELNLDLSYLNSGIYIITVTSNNITVSKKIIKY
ncbi:MAG: hypothetical protein C0598_01540 [Marinilabiliales bacterium]|nr:MAG: hypothetical protein C0598_01540 [Marinilabiliales bacterium]